MRVVLQRVTGARVTVDGEVVGSIGAGVCLLVGVQPEDTETDAAVMASKIAGLRIFPDAEGRMNRSLSDVGGEALVVSQFTLYADIRKGRRPSFTGAAAPEQARPLVDYLAACLRDLSIPVATGSFGAMMSVELTNEGPVTLVIEVKQGAVV